LPRINNARGHLQFRYESKKQAALRDYLTIVFGSTEHANGVLRVSELEPHVFLSEPVSAGRQTIAALSLCNPHFHNCAHVAVGACAEFKELERCFMAIAL
jgi:hypothetical protein